MGSAMAILFGRIFGLLPQLSKQGLQPEMISHAIGVEISKLLILGLVTWIVNGMFMTIWIWFGEVQAQELTKQLFSSFLQCDVELLQEEGQGTAALISNTQS